MRLREMLAKPKRWWRSKGHGIHSPFAYKLVTETLCCREAYYIYDRIENIPVNEWEQELLCLLARLVIRFRPAKVAVVGEWAGACQVIRQVKPDVEIVDVADRPELIVVAEADYLDSEIVPPAVVMVVSIKSDGAPALWQRLMTSTDFGMTFTNDFTGIACLLPHLPRQHFKLLF